jgi:hypothetical protein
MTKVCKRCEQDKAYNEYYLQKNGKPSGSYCKLCRSIIGKETYTQVFARMKKWRADNPEAYAEQYRRSGEKRKLRAKSDPAFRDKLREERRDSTKRNFVSTMLSRAKRRAKKEGQPFDLCVADLIVPEYCPVLGTKMILGTKDNYSSTYSLDRKDPTKGYTKENTRIISMRANTMKSNANREELKMFAKNIITYLDTKI